MPRRALRYDVFISHSSADKGLAARVERVLEESSTSAFLDRSDIRVGVLLRNELHATIRASRLVLLLWSKVAARSRWVAAELLTAFHEKRFIIPARLDGAELPYFLSNAIFVDFTRRRTQALAALPDLVRRAPRGATKVPRFRASPPPQARELADSLARGQQLVTDALGARDLVRARTHQASLDAAQRRAERAFPLDATLLSLGGYHRKNAYMVKHWDAIQAGRPPKDALLVRAERFFFDTLFVDPRDLNALNGLGSILIFERDLEAAEFFVRRALEAARRAGADYPAAEHDLELIRWFRGTSPRDS